MSNTTNKKPSPAIVIMKRELATYFTNPISYIVTGLFLIITGVMFFTTFFLQNRANMRNFFSLLPILFSFFIPALTMRLYSEEKKSGSIETLMTLPVTELQVVTGKFLAAFISSAIMLAPTLLYLVSILFFGKPDIGPIIGGYIGAIFLCAAFSAIGVFASSVTKSILISTPLKKASFKSRGLSIKKAFSFFLKEEESRNFTTYLIFSLVFDDISSIFSTIFLNTKFIL